MMIQRNARAAAIGGLVLTCGIAAGLAFAVSTPTRMTGIEEPGAGVAALAPDWAASEIDTTIPYEAPPVDLAPPTWQQAERMGGHSYLQQDGSPTAMDAGVLDAGLVDSYDDAPPTETVASSGPVQSLDRDDDAAASAQAASEAAAEVTAAVSAPTPEDAAATPPAPSGATVRS